MKRGPLIGVPAYVLPGKSGRHTHAGAPSAYLDAVIAGGGIPVLLPVTLALRKIDSAMSGLDGFLLTGGSDVDPKHYNEEPNGTHFDSILPLRDAVDLHIARRAAARDLPLLAICRGHQILSVALGGALWQNIPSQVPEAIRHDFPYRNPYLRDPLRHIVEITPDSRTAALLGSTRLRVNSVHHQAVRKPGRGLVVTARSRDGLIEATEMPRHRFVVSVQWHPERLLESVPDMRGLFTGLAEAAAKG
jgi:putative glutamine amidotransferase